LLGLVLSAGAMPLVASPLAEAQLREADALRSSDPRRAAELREAIAGDPDITTDQRLRLRYLQAYAEAFAGRYAQAVELAEALIAESDSVELRFRATGLIVNSHAATHNFAEGLRHIDRMMVMLDRVEDRDIRHTGLGAATVLHVQLGQFEQGASLARQVLADQPAPRVSCLMRELLLETRYRRGEPFADAEVDQLIRDCDAIGETVMANLARAYLARQWARQGEHARAADLLEAHLSAAVAGGYPHLIADMNAELALARLALDEIDAAERHALAAVAASEDSPFGPPRVNAFRVLYQIAERRGEPAAALDMYRRYAEADRAYLDDVKARELAFQLVRQETAEKTQSIELLNRQNEVLRLEQAVAKASAQRTGLLAALLAVLASSIGYWAYQIKRGQRALRTLAETDALTGISNRHHFTSLAQRTLANAAKAGSTVGLLMFDLDDFKAINDRYGHATGDWVLRRVAAACAKQCGAADCIGRLGGEEFAILLEGDRVVEAPALAAACRRAIAAIDSSDGGAPLSITASFGIADSRTAGYDLHALLTQADQAMYRSKRAGRDRVSLFTAAAA